MEKRVYLDYAATTNVKPEVLEAMRPYFDVHFGNPSGSYTSAREAKKAIEDARKAVANCLGVSNKEVYFTCGGTESDNWAIRGAVNASAKKEKHIITTNAEHHAVLNVFEQLEKEGCCLTALPVNGQGIVDAEQANQAICEDTVLVSVMTANNEVGTISPVAEISEITHRTGVLFHTDAVAAAGHMNLKPIAAAADMLSISAHKFYGPKGVGALVIKENAKIRPCLLGGEQERGRRAGTENVPGIVGMACALVLAQENMAQEEKRLGELRDMMEGLLREKVPGVSFNGDMDDRLASYVNVCLPEIEAKAALVALDLAGVECSSGSACTTGSVSPSHVLLAMGLPESEAKRALRFTLGADTGQEDVEYAVKCIENVCKRKKIRERSG